MKSPIILQPNCQTLYLNNNWPLRTFSIDVDSIMSSAAVDKAYCECKEEAVRFIKMLTTQMQQTTTIIDHLTNG